MKNKIIFTLITLMFCMSFFYVPVYAAEGIETEDTVIYADETNEDNGENNGYAEDNEDGELDTDNDSTDEPPVIESAIPIGSGFRPFTPPGTGTVVDNASDGDGKEFFTISTDEGDIFYLIIDRQRNSHNVYFLNGVTLDDLAALAQQHGKELNTGTSAVPPAGQPGMGNQNPVETPEPNEPSGSGSNTGMLIFLVIAVAGVGGAAYYFKIVKSKKNAPDDDKYDSNDDDDDGYEYDGEPDDDGEYGDEPDEGGEDE